MKTKLFFLAVVAFFILGCGTTVPPKTSNYKEKRQTQGLQTEYTIINGDTTGIVQKTILIPDSVEIIASYENIWGDSPTMNEMATMRLTNSQANNNDAIQRAVDKDDANLEVYEKIANPGNPNESRAIINIKTDLGNGFSSYSMYPDVVFYGSKQLNRRAYEKALRLKEAGDPSRWNHIMKLLNN